MHKKLLLYIFFGFLFSVDNHFIEYQDQFIKSKTIIIKFNDSYAPKIGFETPILLSNLTQFINTNNFS